MASEQEPGRPFRLEPFTPTPPPPIPPSARELAGKLARIAQRKRIIRRIQFTVMAITGVAILLVFVGVFGREEPGVTSKIYWLYFLATLLGFWGVANQADRSLVALLERENDVAAIGPLADASTLDQMDHGAVAAALMRILPNLRSEEGAALTTEQRDILFGLVSERKRRIRREYSKRAPYRRAEFKILLLKALTQLRDAAALPHVEQLTDCDHPEVRQAALDCRDALKEVERIEHERETLLRASSSSDATLLRPASATAASDPALLLRAE